MINHISYFFSSFQVYVSNIYISQKMIFRYLLSLQYFFKTFYDFQTQCYYFIFYISVNIQNSCAEVDATQLRKCNCWCQMSSSWLCDSCLRGTAQGSFPRFLVPVKIKLIRTFYLVHSVLRSTSVKFKQMQSISKLFALNISSYWIPNIFCSS